MKSKFAFAIIKKDNKDIKILDIYPTKDVAIEEDEFWQAVEIKPVKDVPKRLYGYNKRRK